MAVSFDQEILPLFRPRDRNCMAAFGVALDDFAWMSDPAGDAAFPDHANVRHVHAHLSGTEAPRMPPDGAWPAERIDLLAQWIEEGCQP